MTYQTKIGPMVPTKGLGKNQCGLWGLMDSVSNGWSSDDSVGGSLNIPSGFEEKAKRGQQPPTFADGD